MPLDFFFFNSLVQFIALTVLLVVMFALRKGVEQRALLVCVWLLCLTVLIPRVNEIGVYFGAEVFSRIARVVLTWIVIVILLVTFVHIWQRRVAFGRIAKKIEMSEKYSEVLKQNGDSLNGHPGITTSK